MRAWLLGGMVLGFFVGILFGIVTGLFRISDAQPVALTAAQASRIVKVNQDVNRRFAHFDSRGHGLCGWLAQLKLWALERAGVPDSVMSFQDVLAPPGWSDRYHRLLKVTAKVNGKPWVVALDMNSPWPLDAGAERAMGYRPLANALAHPSHG